MSKLPMALIIIGIRISNGVIRIGTYALEL